MRAAVRLSRRGLPGAGRLLLRQTGDGRPHGCRTCRRDARARRRFAVGRLSMLLRPGRRDSAMRGRRVSCNQQSDCCTGLSCFDSAPPASKVAVCKGGVCATQGSNCTTSTDCCAGQFCNGQGAPRVRAARVADERRLLQRGELPRRWPRKTARARRGAERRAARGAARRAPEPRGSRRRRAQHSVVIISRKKLLGTPRRRPRTPRPSRAVVADRLARTRRVGAVAPAIAPSTSAASSTVA